jgi:tRNA (guanine10-N2)-methyltransferase
MAPYLVQFVHKWNAMRLPELEAVAQLLGIEIRIDERGREALALDLKCVTDNDPLRRAVEVRECASIIVDFPSDDAVRRIASRLMLVDKISELWGHGSTWDEAFAMLEQNRRALIEPHDSPDKTFRIRIDAFGPKSASHTELIEMLLPRLKLSGRVQMKGADNTIIAYVDHTFRRVPGQQTRAPPRHVHIARRVAVAPGLGYADTFKLPERRFLGPTSMDHQLSMIIANQAHARPGALVLDPFCGTASILVGCAAFGARVLGCDLDARYLVGKGEGLTIGANFEQYHMEQPIGLVRADFAAEADCWRALPFLDAIVCDPPYGHRASSKKLADGSAELLREKHAQGDDTYIAKREPMEMNALLERLLDFAASRLVIGGRLVFLLPTTADMVGSAAPEHPVLRLHAESPQPISRRWCRRLVTMEKVRPHASEMRVSFERREASLFDTAKLGKLPPQAGSKEQRRRNKRAAAGEEDPPETYVRKRFRYLVIPTLAICIYGAIRHFARR